MRRNIVITEHKRRGFFACCYVNWWDSSRLVTDKLSKTAFLLLKRFLLFRAGVVKGRKQMEMPCFLNGKSLQLLYNFHYTLLVHNTMCHLLVCRMGCKCRSYANVASTQLQPCWDGRRWSSKLFGFHSCCFTMNHTELKGVL